MPEGDDNLRDRRTPRPPNPEELERLRHLRDQAEPFEPVVGAPHVPPSEGEPPVR